MAIAEQGKRTPSSAAAALETNGSSQKQWRLSCVSCLTQTEGWICARCMRTVLYSTVPGRRPIHSYRPSLSQQADVGTEVATNIYGVFHRLIHECVNALFLHISSSCLAQLLLAPLDPHWSVFSPLM